MPDKNLHTNYNKGELDKFLKTATIPYKKTKDDVWVELDKFIDKSQSNSPEIVKSATKVLSLWQMGIAASIIIVLGLVSFMRLYTINIETFPGEHTSYILPDNSTVEINSNSELTYHPYWWNISRKINFSGEGYFKVEKGKKFEVISNSGTTTVLGTSFNIYARSDDYNVTCITGKVKVVVAESNYSVILNPDEKAELNVNGILNIEKLNKPKQIISWVEGNFVFTAEPISKVFEEISRQYNVKINFPKTTDLTYTGNFTKQKSVNEVLSLVCKPFEIKFEKNPNGDYTIKIEE